MATTNKNEDAAITAANNAARVSTIKGGSIAKPITVERPVMAGLELGDKYDIQYNQDYIWDLLDKATTAEYNRKRQEFAATENKFYNELYDTQASALDAIRASNSAAVATGATKGMAAAQQLAAILGLEQSSVESATDLANQRNELAAKEAEAYAKNANTALETSNALKQTIAEDALNKYGYDTQGYVGALEYNAALQSVLGEIIQSQNAASATMYNADRNLAGTQYAADKNGKYSGGRYSGGSGSGSRSGSKSGSGSGSGSKKNYNNGKQDTGTIKAMQSALGIGADGYWGPKSQEAAQKKWGVSSADKAYNKWKAAIDKADQAYQGNDATAVTTKTYNGKKYQYNKTTGGYVYNGKPYASESALKAAINADVNGPDATTGAAPKYNWTSNSTVSGETIYYDKGSGKYKYKDNIYSTEKAAREARDKAIKNKNKKSKSNTQQNHSTTGTINQIKWL